MATFLDRRKRVDNNPGFTLYVKATDSQFLQPIENIVRAQSIAVQLENNFESQAGYQRVAVLSTWIGDELNIGLH
jgi:hypothetical protein